MTNAAVRTTSAGWPPRWAPPCRGTFSRIPPRDAAAGRYVVPVSSSQVPLWVTILIAFVGLLGVLSAQFIAAWREDRRWRRDRQREIDNRDFEGRRDAYS